MATNNSEEINFQHYVDSVKQKRIDWNMFVDVIQDISYSDKDRLRRLNAILLNELTSECSDMDKLKYLNLILLRQFKNDIEKEQEIEMTQSEDLVTSDEANDQEILNEDTNNKNEENYVNSEMSNADEIKNDANEENLAVSCKEEVIESKSNAKLFHCYICSKEYNMNFHLKRHNKNIHEKRKSYNSPKNTIQYDQKPKESEITVKSISNANNSKRNIPSNEGKKDYRYDSQNGKLKTHIQTIREVYKDYKCESCEKSFTNLRNLERHLHTVHDGYRDYKCEFCGKSSTTAQNLKKHIYTVHDGYKDHKCEFCGKSFTEARSLKKHIYIVHEGHKNHK